MHCHAAPLHFLLLQPPSTSAIALRVTCLLNLVAAVVTRAMAASASASLVVAAGGSAAPVVEGFLVQASSSAGFGSGARRMTRGGLGWRTGGWADGQGI